MSHQEDANATSPSPAGGARAPSSPRTTSSWFTVPAPVRRLFKRFPLVTYPANELPWRSPHGRDLSTLYVFISEEDAPKGLPSFNPSCLKWKVFLKLAGVQFRIVSSSNHASPTGALPFLIPPSTPSDATTQKPVPSSKLEQFALDKGSQLPEAPTLKLEAYQSLLDHRIRNAWLYALYLSPANTPLLSKFYITPISHSYAVKTTILHQLRYAAEAEILKSTGLQAVDPNSIYAEAEEALEALETLLGSDLWFFGAQEPGLFDAAVFSYTHLLLDDRTAWEESSLTNTVKKFPAIIQHRNRVLARCWDME